MGSRRCDWPWLLQGKSKQKRLQIQEQPRVLGLTTPELHPQEQRPPLVDRDSLSERTGHAVAADASV